MWRSGGHCRAGREKIVASEDDIQIAPGVAMPDPAGTSPARHVVGVAIGATRARKDTFRG